MNKVDATQTAQVQCWCLRQINIEVHFVCCLPSAFCLNMTQIGAGARVARVSMPFHFSEPRFSQLSNEADRWSKITNSNDHRDLACICVKLAWRVKIIGYYWEPWLSRSCTSFLKAVTFKMFKTSLSLGPGFHWQASGWLPLEWKIVFHEPVSFLLGNCFWRSPVQVWLHLSSKFALFACSVKMEVGPSESFPMPAGTRFSCVSMWCWRDTAGGRSLLPDSSELAWELLHCGQCPVPASAVLQHLAPAGQVTPQAFGSHTACNISTASYCSAVIASVPRAALRATSQAYGSCSLAASPVSSFGRMCSFSSTQLLQHGWLLKHLSTAVHSASLLPGSCSALGPAISPESLWAFL